MGKETTDYVSEMVFQNDPVTVTRKARDIIVSDKHWQLLDYMEGHYVQAKRRTGITNWSILLSIRIESQMGSQKVTLLGETYGKGPLVSSGLKKKVDQEIVAPLQTAFKTS
ncbi:MAG: hypothetical protein PHW93_02120 [Candidatus Methanomethylophilaceae archaeon]|jgi:hypothetical protein|nr:hypothetical protein [Candidatus Methanomethylophilaceae archaeon]